MATNLKPLLSPSFVAWVQSVGTERTLWCDACGWHTSTDICTKAGA